MGLDVGLQTGVAPREQVVACVLQPHLVRGRVRLRVRLRGRIRVRVRGRAKVRARVMVG